jgi:bifunctional DNA-binding transcriptional regulator/antitoxin component of YhaV-PrlF toxin-antitoxin module
MVTILAKTRRVGGSLMVTLPKEAVDALGIREDEPVEIEVRIPRRSYLGVLRGIGSFAEDDRADHA